MTAPLFLADEDLRFEIVSAVRRLEQGSPIVTVRELGGAGDADAAILELAAKQNRIAVSHDVNTMRAAA